MIAINSELFCKQVQIMIFVQLKQGFFLHQDQLSCFHPTGYQYLSVLSECYLVYKIACYDKL